MSRFSWWRSNRALLLQILHNEEQIMATLSDISTALDAVSSTVTEGFQTLTTDLQTLLTDLGTDPAKVQAIVDSVNKLGTGIQDSVSSLDDAIKTADPGAPLA